MLSEVESTLWNENMKLHVIGDRVKIVMTTCYYMLSEHCTVTLICSQVKNWVKELRKMLGNDICLCIVGKSTVYLTLYIVISLLIYTCV